MSPTHSTAAVFVIVPVHNRRETTLRCLRHLAAESAPEPCQVVLVDDGSTDGTAEAVRREFPAVHIIRGDGTLYWTGAIECGMRHAYAAGAEFIVWLNDDCQPRPGALNRLVEITRRERAVAGAVSVLPHTGAAIYGGYRRGRSELEFIAANPGEQHECDALNGNLVCLPREVVAEIGFPDGAGLPHAMGDLDYTLRARGAGFQLVLAGDAQAEAVPNNPRGFRSWLLSGMSVGQIWATLGDRRAYGYFPAELRFRTRHWGIAGALRACWSVIKRVPISVAVVLVPVTLRRRWWGQRSAAWKLEQLVRTETAVSDADSTAES